MPYSLSLLDKSPILDGEPATDAIRRSVALAQAAERLGYARFWLAEHHGAPGLASSAPEILIAHLAARTQRIRIGSGGVLLGHYSPYKVAETFNLLATLAPDRVDLGIGKAPGGLPFSTRALRARQAEAAPFGELLRELNDYLLDRSKASPGIDVAKAFPAPPAPPERFCWAPVPKVPRLPPDWAGGWFSQASSTAIPKRSKAASRLTRNPAASGRRC